GNASYRWNEGRPPGLERLSFLPVLCTEDCPDFRISVIPDDLIYPHEALRAVTPGGSAVFPGFDQSTLDEIRRVQNDEAFFVYADDYLPRASFG
ncbi:MAG: hypothetical protein AAGA56_13170, partial [Myxococcota bacterium]